MPEIKIAKLKTRRGTNNQRLLVTPDQGEIISTIDTKRVYLGTGTLLGGTVVGTKVHPPLTNYTSLSNTIAEIGDLVIANNKFYQLTAINYGDLSSWADISLKIDTTIFNYTTTNNLTLNLSGVDAGYIDPTTVSNGIIISGGILQSNHNTKSLEISANQLSIKASGIDEREISSTSFSNGIVGGSGYPIYLDVDTDYFAFDGNSLTLTDVITNGGVTFESLSSEWFQSGLYYNELDGYVESIVKDVDTNIFKSLSDTSGVIYLETDAVSGVNHWPQITVDNHGLVKNQESAIRDVLTGNSTTGTLSALFNGDSLGLSAIQVTTFTGLSSDGVTSVTLSSAGFITFENDDSTNTTTRNGGSVGRFAIPIFRY